RAAQAAVPPEFGAELDRLIAGLTSVHDELREYARGIHPAILTEGGLARALRILARRSSVPVELDVRTKARLPERAEVAAYYVVSEALTNAAKHAQASAVMVAVEAAGGILRVLVRGTGLLGLKDRVEAFGGRLFLDSPRGAGTILRVELPLIDADRVTSN
ncbi:MAG TPA: sensor histidine kinase, partial [Streptosporangiaceae bacterium]|nr:sensor histidine kinase [Streptosporangiaceae bacterium]